MPTEHLSPKNQSRFIISSDKKLFHASGEQTKGTAEEQIFQVEEETAERNNNKIIQTSYGTTADQKKEESAYTKF